MHLIPNWFRRKLFSNRCFLKLRKIHVKTSLLELLFNNVTGLKAWNFIKKRLRYRRISLWIFSNFSKNFIYRAPPDDCSCWFLRSNQCFIHWSHLVRFFLHFCSFVIDNRSCGSLLRKCLKMRIFLLFTIVYSKININVKTISPRQ